MRGSEIKRQWDERQWDERQWDERQTYIIEHFPIVGVFGSYFFPFLLRNPHREWNRRCRLYWCCLWGWCWFLWLSGGSSESSGGAQTDAKQGNLSVGMVNWVPQDLTQRFGNDWAYICREREGERTCRATPWVCSRAATFSICLRTCSRMPISWSRFIACAASPASLSWAACSFIFAITWAACGQCGERFVWGWWWAPLRAWLGQ